jgi:hypothetical protein
MSPIQQVLFILFLLIFVAIGYAWIYRKDLIQKQWFMDKYLLERGKEKPNLWLFYPTSEVNSRNWLDAGQRSSRALNIPFLNLCYQSIVAHNKDNYHIRVISGISGLSELLGEDRLPSLMRRHGDLASLGPAEMDWIRSAVLAAFGGLWLNPASVCMNGFGEQPVHQVVFYGTDHNQTYSGKNGTPLPGPHALWSPRPQHPMFVEWEQVCYARVNEKRGGEQIRGDWGWDVSRFTSQYSGEGIVIDPHAEVSRKKDGKRIQLEDLLAAGTEGNLTFDVYPHSIYVPFPWDELQRREIFGWFLRMSESQIMESDLAVKYLLSRR